MKKLRLILYLVGLESMPIGIVMVIKIGHLLYFNEGLKLRLDKVFKKAAGLGFQPRIDYLKSNDGA